MTPTPTPLGSGTGAPTPASTPTPTPEPRPSLVVPAGSVRPGEPVRVRTDGRFLHVTVRGDDGRVLEGKISDGGRRWSPTRTPPTGTTYTVEASVQRSGKRHVLTERFRTAAVEEKNRLTLRLRPGGGDVVGVGAPAVVRFTTPVDDRAAVERALVVRADSRLRGAWHWVDDSHARFRPEHYWPAGTKVNVQLLLDGVKAGKNLYGGRDYDLPFRVGQPRSITPPAGRRPTNGSSKATSKPVSTTSTMPCSCGWSPAGSQTAKCSDWSGRS